jgi:phosphohistidine phosphatase
MQLYIMRHGEASMKADTDAQRPLTKQGNLEASLMAKWLSNMDVTFDQILVSPYIRAQQTSAIVVSTLNAQQKSSTQQSITTVDFITPSGNANDVHSFIDDLCVESSCEHLLIVSHMPLVSYLVAELTFEQQCPIFQTAAIAQIDYQTNKMKGELVRIISPIDLC